MPAEYPCEFDGMFGPARHERARWHRMLHCSVNAFVELAMREGYAEEDAFTRILKLLNPRS